MQRAEALRLRVSLAKILTPLHAARLGTLPERYAIQRAIELVQLLDLDTLLDLRSQQQAEKELGRVPRRCATS